VCVHVCVHMCVCARALVHARVVVTETEISRWVYVYVRVGMWEAVTLCIVGLCRRQDGNIDSICTMYIAY